MELTNPWSPQEQEGTDGERKKLLGRHGQRASDVDQNFIALLDTIEMARIEIGSTLMDITEKQNNVRRQNIAEDKPVDIDADGKEGEGELGDDSEHANNGAVAGGGAAGKVAIPDTPAPDDGVDTREEQAKIYIETVETQKVTIQSFETLTKPYHKETPIVIKRGTAILVMLLLAMIVLQGVMGGGPTQFLGAQGWASVLGGPVAGSGPDLLGAVNKQITHAVKPGVTATATVQMTPEQYIDLIVHRMTLDQKLGQMMIVQFVGGTYTLPISTMISQYNVGAVLVFASNGNVVDKGQLTDLIRQMKSNSTTIPLAVAIDQEGGTVDRLVNLDGPRPAAATIGASNNPATARQAGIQDAQDLAGYGFNLNLAPVVDVTNVYNEQMDGRTFGGTAGQVTKMASAYLQGLQQSGKVVGTLKHFPGLGDVAVDPHIHIPFVTRTKSELESIDWAPYRAMIKSGNVHALMVTHEIIQALDPTQPSSLSPKIIQNILRNDLGFQGVIMTDSLTMKALTAYASESQAAVMSIEAGTDLLMGAASPEEVASMFQAIKQAMSTGALTEQRIDQSVRRILMMKYAMGLLPIPKN